MEIIAWSSEAWYSRNHRRCAIAEHRMKIHVKPKRLAIEERLSCDMFSLSAIGYANRGTQLNALEIAWNLRDDAIFGRIFSSAAACWIWIFTFLRNKRVNMRITQEKANARAAHLMLKPPESIKNRNIAISIRQFKFIKIYVCFQWKGLIDNDETW